MFTGKSVWHVNQDLGKTFARDSVRGYYNNMTEKVTQMPSFLESTELPTLNYRGEIVEMPVAIFQYGLGAYDLFLLTNDQKYLSKFFQAVEWAMNHLDDHGRWNNFYYIYPDHPYGAMAQGEGASLLVRAYVYCNKQKYLDAAKRAIDFMLLPICKGGTSLYDKDELVLAEYTHRPIVMNGWIFAWWGLYDYVLATEDNGIYKCYLDVSCSSLIKYLPKFKTAYWSKYDLSGRIASPFYHNLHIAQMQAMYELTGEVIFREYSIRWERQQRKLPYKCYAFMKKAIQKLME